MKLLREVQGRSHHQCVELFLEAYNYECAYCGSSENLQIDHIHPVSKGGWKNWDNLQVLCQDCNLRKSDRT